MTVRRLLLWTCLLLAPRALAAQAPHLTGTLDLDLAAGRISGDVCLDRLPEQDSLRFLLHRGLNIRSIRDGAGRRLAYSGHSELMPVGVALRYTVTDSLAAPRVLCVAYTGAFPVYEDQESTFDNQEAIAFNSRTVRAAAATAWYPVLYHPRTERRHEEVTYRLDVSCPDCATIYLNGARPLSGPAAVASSATPRLPLLFAGDFAHREVGGTIFLNSEVSDDEARVLSTKLAEVQEFYADLLRVPFRDTLVFLHHRPIQRFPQGRVWGFVSFPTFAYAGIDFGALAGGLAATPPNPTIWGLLAHETAHYYFGTVLSPVGAYSHFFVESIAEYLALRAVRRFVGEGAYHEALRRARQAVLAGPELPSLHRAGADALRQDLYRYRYGPLLLVAMEREIGEDAMDELLRRLLAAPRGAVLDYAYLREQALAAGVPRGAWRRFERRCIAPDPKRGCLRDLAPAG